jgi:hypothetical protein
MTSARPETRRKYQANRSNPGMPALNSEFGRSDITADIEPSSSYHRDRPLWNEPASPCRAIVRSCDGPPDVAESEDA